MPSRYGLGMEEIGDIWGRPLRYVRSGQDYAIRSAGADGRFETADDIVIQGRLARTVPCAFQVGRELRQCDEKPPVCAVSSATASFRQGEARLPFTPRLSGLRLADAANHVTGSVEISRLH